MVNPFMSQILRSIQRLTGNLAQQLPLSKKLSLLPLTQKSNRASITEISSKEPDLQSSSTEPIIIEEGSQEEIKNQLDQLFDNQKIPSSSVNFEVHPSVTDNFFQALEERSREKNPEYHKLLDKLSSLEKDPGSREELNKLLKDPQLPITLRESINEHYGSITLISPRAKLNNEPIIGLSRTIKSLDIIIPDKPKNTLDQHLTELHSFIRALSIPSCITNTIQDIIEVKNPIQIDRLSYISDPNSHCLETGQEFAIDITAPNMKIGTPVYSTTNGKVIKVDDQYPDREENVFNLSNENNPGNSIYVKSDNGLISFYTHLKQNSCLKLGETVQVGQKIAEIGNTGASTALHLHYAIGKKDESFPWGIRSLPVRFK
ncbi:MAG: M23 family metallopeptidase [Vampirovibrionia bacterium]